MVTGSSARFRAALLSTPGHRLQAVAAGLWLRGESRPGQSPVRLDTQGWATVPGSPLAPSKLGPRPWPEKSVCQRQEPALSLGPARTVGLVPREDRKAGWWAVGGKARLLFPRLWAGPARQATRLGHPSAAQRHLASPGGRAVSGVRRRL